LVDECITNTILSLLTYVGKYFLQKQNLSSLEKNKLCVKFFAASAQEHAQELKKLVTTYTPDNGTIIENFGFTMRKVFLPTD